MNRELDSIDEQLIVQPALLSYHVLTSRRGLPRLSAATVPTAGGSSLLATPVSASSSRANSPASTSASSSSSTLLQRATSDDNGAPTNSSTSSAASSSMAARLRHSRSMSAFLPASQTATSSTRSGVAHGVDRDWNAEYQDIYSTSCYPNHTHTIDDE